MPELDFFLFLQHSVPNVVSSFEYFSSFSETLRPYFSSFGSSFLIHRRGRWAVAQQDLTLIR